MTELHCVTTPLHSTFVSNGKLVSCCCIFYCCCCRCSCCCGCCFCCCCCCWCGCAAVVEISPAPSAAVAPTATRQNSDTRTTAFRVAHTIYIEWQIFGASFRKNLQTKFTATIKYTHTQLIELAKHEMKLITCVHCSVAHEKCCLI